MFEKYKAQKPFVVKRTSFTGKDWNVDRQAEVRTASVLRFLVP